MSVTFSLSWLLALVIVPVLTVVNLPALYGGISAIEVGKYRVAWTRYGWSYQYDYKYPTGTNGFWPWHAPTPPAPGRE